MTYLSGTTAVNNNTNYQGMKKNNCQPNYIVPKNNMNADSISFSGTQTNGNRSQNNNELLTYVFGGLVAATCIILAMAGAKKGKIVPKAITEKLPDTKSYGGSSSHTAAGKTTKKVHHYGGSSTKEYIKDIKASTRKLKQENETYRQARIAQKEKFNLFKDQFNKIVADTPLENLKQEISKQIPGIATADRPSLLLANYFSKSDKPQDENFLINLYAFVKKQPPNAKDGEEALRFKQSGLFVLSKLRSKILSNITNDSHLIVAKYEWLEEQIGKEVDDLLSPEMKNSLPTKVIAKIKEEANNSCLYTNPYQAFCFSLNHTSESCLNDIAKSHISNGKMTTEGENLLKIAENMNDEASLLNMKMGTTDDLVKLSLGSTRSTIKNFKNGNFKSGRDEFWDEYFDRKYKTNNQNRTNENSENSNKSNDNHKKYNESDTKNESLNIFKKYGEDLGDLNSLKIDSLKKARAKLSLKYHPDRNKNDDTTRIMQEINAAFDELINLAK